MTAQLGQVQLDAVRFHLKEALLYIGDVLMAHGDMPSIQDDAGAAQTELESAFALLFPEDDMPGAPPKDVPR